MGIFGDNIKSSPFGWARRANSTNRHIEFIIGTNLLEKEEINDILCAISFDPNCAGIIYPRSALKTDTIIIISERTVYYEGPNNIAKLGEHVLENPRYDGHETIELFINSIRKSACQCSLNSGVLLVSVFIHELYHSYFHKNSVVPEIEEPLAELGSILFMNSWLDNDDEFKSVLEFVYKKKEFPEISFYGLGADLFCEAKGNNEYYFRCESPQLLLLYRAKHIENDSKTVKEYKSRFPHLYAAESYCEETRELTRRSLLHILGCELVPVAREGVGQADAAGCFGII